MGTDIVIKHCAPTLAGLKEGNLFSHEFENEQKLRESIDWLNDLLNHKGLFFVVLKQTENWALVYAYRKQKLETVLQCPKVRRFLASNGYNSFSINDTIELLKEHLIQDEFPHERGVFLGYPLPDIIAFIENKGNDYLFVGFWKVYSNESEARRKFNLFSKCTRIYCQKAKDGVGITKLAVAG